MKGRLNPAGSRSRGAHTGPTGRGDGHKEWQHLTMNASNLAVEGLHNWVCMVQHGQRSYPLAGVTVQDRLMSYTPTPSMYNAGRGHYSPIDATPGMTQTEVLLPQAEV